MNRTPRYIHEKGFFHIMVQGINKDYIFKKNIDKEDYLSLLLRYRKDFNVTLLAYCIMDNHAHILIYTDEIYELSRYMGRINSRFARNYNIANERVGYVFRDRFNSQYIDTNDYLLKCLNYIHMNPVKAKIVERPEEYVYSSYKNYLEKSGNVDDTVIKRIFNKSNSYLSQFLSIPDDEIEIMDVDRRATNFIIAVEKYLNMKNLNLDTIKSEKEKLYDFCKHLIIEKKYKQIEVANLLEIDKCKIYYIMNRNKH